eukprot:TRINITY_DN641_c0_g1_i1.p1 TRINITY_DN641_c0_g1~~TRINITY_DN641_c0_g1_i1.p1  ORF type:complete len:212 (-),score=50.89 TRINITY_DN641_c0_g1_i1:127-762(-)
MMDTKVGRYEDSHFIGEVNREVDGLHQQIVELHAVQAQLNNYIGEQAEPISLIEEKVQNVEKDTVDSVVTIAQASKLKSKKRIMTVAAVGAVVGGAIGGAVGIIGGPAGIAIGIAAGASAGGTLGGGLGSKVLNNEDKLLMQMHNKSLFHYKDTCELCNRKFGLLSPQRHCKLCGNSVCGDCSPHQAPMKYVGIAEEQNVRMCSSCHLNKK